MIEDGTEPNGREDSWLLNLLSMRVSASVMQASISVSMETSEASIIKTDLTSAFVEYGISTNQRNDDERTIYISEISF